MTTKRGRKKKVGMLRRERHVTRVNSFYKNGKWQNVDMSYRVVM